MACIETSVKQLEPRIAILNYNFNIFLKLSGPACELRLQADRVPDRELLFSGYRSRTIAADLPPRQTITGEVRVTMYGNYLRAKDRSGRLNIIIAVAAEGDSEIDFANVKYNIYGVLIVLIIKKLCL